MRGRTFGCFIFAASGFLCLLGQRRGHTCIFSRLRIITTCLPSFPAGRSAPQQHQSVHPALVPPAGEVEMRMHLGVWGVTPAGVQRAAPSGAVRIGRPSGEERSPRRRPLRRGAPAAEAAPPARSARCGGEKRWGAFRRWFFRTIFQN